MRAEQVSRGEVVQSPIQMVSLGITCVRCLKTGTDSCLLQNHGLPRPHLEVATPTGARVPRQGEHAPLDCRLRLAQGAKARYQMKVVMAIQKKIPVQMMKTMKKETRSRMPTVTRKKVMARRGVLAALERKPLDPKLRIRSLRVVLRRAGQADGVNMSGIFFFSLLSFDT